MVDAESIRKFHMAPKAKGGNGWVDIGYHWVVTPKGLVEKGRDEEVAGAHCQGHNTNSIGLCLGGRGPEFPEPQLFALRYLAQNLMKKYSIKNENVKAHHELDIKGKTCPNLPANLLRAFLWID